MTDMYDILILGGGPIGASTAYFLTKESSLKVGLLRREPNEDPQHLATYKYAGGSVRWFWDEAEKAAATKETADFLKQLISEGVDLSELQNNYLFLNRGAHVPSLNISSVKLVDHLIEVAQSKGLEVNDGIEIQEVEKSSDGYVVKSIGKEWRAKKVLVALGIENNKFVKGLSIDEEKRTLFVLNIVVDENREKFPHTVFKIGDGVAYLFVKKFVDGLKFVVGQEGIIDANEEREEEDYFRELLSAGLADHAPFIKDAKVEKILWGIDSGNKTLSIFSEDKTLFAANSGSAVRSCAYIGRTLAETLR
ncbi:MAG: FAD-dependent oxidoreductase [Patescibacteria group bacterium]